MFKEVIPEKAWKILEIISPIVVKENFYLAGGTGLALQIGHRISEDFDFFREKSFNPDMLSSLIKNVFNQIEITMIEKDTLLLNIEGIKFSFFRYDIPLLFKPVNIENILVADWQDITAEKFKTIAQRGSKKDFYDLYCVFYFKKLTIKEAVDIFKKRFFHTGLNFYHVLRSLIYFEDAEKEPEPKLLSNCSWEDVKSFFITHLKDFEKCLLE